MFRCEKDFEETVHEEKGASARCRCQGEKGKGLSCASERPLRRIPKLYKVKYFVVNTAAMY